MPLAALTANALDKALLRKLATPDRSFVGVPSQLRCLTRLFFELVQTSALHTPHATTSDPISNGVVCLAISLTPNPRCAQICNSL
jgi:hypothetical protein